MPAWLIPALLGASGIFGGAAKGSADQRQSENAQIAERNRLLAQLYGTNQAATLNALQGKSAEQIAHAGVDMDRKKFALQAPSVRAGQSVRGSIMANAKPFTVNAPGRVAAHIPQISGGLTPAMFSDDTRALGSEMSRKALLDQLKGDEFTPLEATDFQSGVLPTPKLEDYQKSGLLEKILGGLSVGASIGGGIGSAVSNVRRVPLDNPFEAGG